MLKQPMSPSVPTYLLRYFPPGASARSSTTLSLRLRAIFRMGSRSATFPQWWVGARATVRGVMQASMRSGSIWSDPSTSQKIGTPPGELHGHGRGHEAKPGTDHLRPRPDARGDERGMQRSRTRAHGVDVLHAEGPARQGFQLFSLGRPWRAVVPTQMGPFPGGRSWTRTAVRIRFSAEGLNPNRSAMDRNSSIPIFGWTFPVLLPNAFEPPSIASRAMPASYRSPGCWEMPRSLAASPSGPAFHRAGPHRAGPP